MRRGILHFLAVILCVSCAPGLTPHNLPDRLANAGRRAELERTWEIEDLVKRLASPDDRERADAFSLLRQKGPEAKPALFRAATSGTPLVELDAVKLIALLKDPATIAPMLEIARNSSNADLRLEAIAALALLGDRAAVPGILLVAEREKALFIKQRIARTLGSLKDARAIPLLLKWLAQEEFHLRIESIRALGFVGDREAVVPLMNHWRGLSGHERPEEQTEIADALGTIGSREATSLLREKLGSSPSILVRSSCARALGAIGDESAIDDLMTALQNPSNALFWSAHRSLVKITGVNCYSATEDREEARKKTFDAWHAWRRGRQKSQIPRTNQTPISNIQIRD
ncbi:MAG: hypothetical protein A2Z34_09720 [Planctomycetes bacterium RBG_16_59_8]|nr:MAG: hypothetical protein A2Z34_09720 [Planctomycetes bacterium RBG_16_59_8]